MLERTICPVCKAEFFKKHNNHKYCTKACTKAAQRKAYKEEVRQKMPQPKKPKFTLSEIARAAKKEGITYGEYVTKHGL